MARNREQILAFKVSSEYVNSLNQLCDRLERGRSDVLRYCVAEFVKSNLADAVVFAETKKSLF